MLRVYDCPMDTLSEAEIIEIDGGDFRTRYRWMLSELSDLNAPALAAQCHGCGTPMSWKQWLTSANHAQTECVQCGHWLYFDDCTADLPSEELLAELRSPGYFDRTWYHASLSENWFERVQGAADGGLIVHAGDRLTALSRADYLRSEREARQLPAQTVYLHSFRLSAAEPFSADVLDDCDEYWQEQLSKPSPMAVLVSAPGSKEQMVTLTEATPGATYYNRYELPGTLSLIFTARSIDGASTSTEILS